MNTAPNAPENPADQHPCGQWHDDNCCPNCGSRGNHDLCPECVAYFGEVNARLDLDGDDDLDFFALMPGMNGDGGPEDNGKDTTICLSCGNARPLNALALCGHCMTTLVWWLAILAGSVLVLYVGWVASVLAGVIW
jgi:membrane protease subunit (stomatin/prohibitin family)